MTRVDLYLVQKGFATGRDAAKRLIAEGGVKLDGKPVLRPSEQVDETMPHDVVLPAKGQGYASRGGLKLEGALDASGLSPAGLVALDIAAARPRFTPSTTDTGSSPNFSGAIPASR